MFDDRVLQVGIEVDGQLQVFSDSAITVKYKKTSDAKQNSCDVTIANLDPELIDYLVTETSPWNPNSKPKVLTVLAGRESTGVDRVFTGEVVSAIPTSPPDRILQIKVQTQESTKYKFSAVNSPKTIQLSELSQKIADQYGLRLQFEADDKTLSNYTYNGTLSKQIKKLEMVGDIDAYIDDETLVVKNLGKGLKGEVFNISIHTGMIGAPSLDERGVKVRILFDPNRKLGEQVAITSLINKAANGQFVSYELSASLANRAQDWYMDLSCNNDNIKSIAEKKAAEKKNDSKPKT